MDVSYHMTQLYVDDFSELLLFINEKELKKLDECIESRSILVQEGTKENSKYLITLICGIKLHVFVVEISKYLILPQYKKY